MNTLEENLQQVQQRIESAAHSAGRSPEDVRLIAVSKKQSADAISALMQLGQVDFAENQMREALEKIENLGQDALCWHFIGHLQSNKTKLAPGHFTWVHSVDSEKLVGRIATAAGQAGSAINLLLQVNVANDPAKHGIHAQSLLPLIERVLEQNYTGIQLRGLMTIGYRGASEADARCTFAALRELLEQCRQRFGENFSELSMGMSHDYAVAIEEGATMVRVGTGLFGERGS